MPHESFGHRSVYRLINNTPFGKPTRWIGGEPFGWITSNAPFGKRAINALIGGEPLGWITSTVRPWVLTSKRLDRSCPPCNTLTLSCVPLMIPTLEALPAPACAWNTRLYCPISIVPAKFPPVARIVVSGVGCVTPECCAGVAIGG